MNLDYSTGLGFISNKLLDLSFIKTKSEVSRFIIVQG